MSILKSYIILLFAFFISCGQSQKIHEPLSNNEAIIAVKTIPIKSQSSKISISASGFLETDIQIKHAFKIGGVVNRIFVSQGQSFKKGQLLATLKTDEIDAKHAQALLSVQKAERDYQRVTKLFKDSVATLEQTQNSLTALQVAKAQLQEVVFNQSFCSIYANHDGFVSNKLAEENEIVAGGNPILISHAPSGNKWVFKVGLSDKNWVLLSIDDTATVFLEAFPKLKLKGVVSQKSRVVDFQSATFQAEITIDCKNLSPAVGMFGKATIHTKNRRNYTAIPFEAMVEADGLNGYVFVPIKNNRVRKQKIVIENFSENEILVRSGLENVNEIILTNAAFLSEKSKISITHTNTSK